MPGQPPESARRDVDDQHAHEAQVHAWRVREYEAKRSHLMQLEQHRLQEADRLLEEAARLSETINARERLFTARVL